MAIGGYIGDENGIAQKVSKIYIGDEDGVAQEVVKVYIGDENGIAQLCYSNRVQVALAGMNKQVYCIVEGATYDSGDVTLELEYGTPVYIHFLETEMMNTQVYLNSDQLSDAVQNGNPVRYVVTGEVSIACSVVGSGISTTKKVVITEAEPKSICFVKRTNWSTGEIDNEVFCCRGGMTWEQFVGSMYNNGDFTVNSGNVLHHSKTVLDPSDDNYTSGYPVNATDKIIHKHTYI